MGWNLKSLLCWTELGLLPEDTGEPWKNMEQGRISDLHEKGASCPVNCHGHHWPLSNLPALFSICTFPTHLDGYNRSFPLGRGSHYGTRGSQRSRHVLRSQWFLENQVPLPNMDR